VLCLRSNGLEGCALAENSRAKEKPDGFMMAALYPLRRRDAALRLLEQVPVEREKIYYDLRLAALGSYFVATRALKNARLFCAEKRAVIRASKKS